MIFIHSPTPRETRLREVFSEVLATRQMPGATMGIVIEDAESRKILYFHNPNSRLLPASNEKLFTCSFALWKLGPTYRPATRFWKDHGGITVATDGDPMLSPHDLRLARHILGGRSRKPLKVYQAYSPGVPDSWEVGDLPNRYAAPVAALTVDRGGLELWNVNGKPVLRPRAFDVQLQKVSQLGQPDAYDIQHRIVKVNTPLPKVTKRIDTLAIPDPTAAAAAYLASGWRRINQAPSKPPTYIHLGAPLPDTMRTCLQMSDNNIAENFLLMAGSNGKALKEAYPESLKSLKAFLDRTVGLQPNDHEADDGSGLSRHNWTTPSCLVSLLHWCLNQPTGPLWRTMLDHPGSGTLTYRLKDIMFQGKTGTLTGVSAISGYLEVGGKLYILSILSNNYHGSSKTAKALEDLLIRKAYRALQFGTAIASQRSCASSALPSR